ncbi:MAG: class I poly(R)-hydroxyalkanoic acid synthase [Gammaproteobacteria bacterium]|nr:class I poly(R)-hydroxyalkanoic acid synthase [Gammaproteobacteria bacterium]
MNHFQNPWQYLWEQCFENLNKFWSAPLHTSSVSAESLPQLPANVQLMPDKWASAQQQYLDDLKLIYHEDSRNRILKKDKRFSSDVWLNNPVASFTTALYLVNAKNMLNLIGCIETDEKTLNRIKFSVDQWISATAPTNFLALNAEVQKKIIESNGQSLQQGTLNLLNDIRRKHISMTDESQYEIGVNIACTPGKVVFQNEFFELIEYTPTTPKIHKIPFLLIPPCINKYYILDLQAHNSFAKYCIDNGLHTFIISWRNPVHELDHATWDDYIEQGAIKAIEVVNSIGKNEGVNALGFCVGGTILSNALAVLQHRKINTVRSATFLTSLVDFTHTGVLDIFIDENFVKFRELQFTHGGIMSGQDMAQTFSFLRPNDLVWNYIVGNYLKGETPPLFDLLYWNTDSTHLPGPMYAWYLRNTYLENNLVKPNKLTVCHSPINIQAIQIPLFFYASKEDHIVPIAGAYQSALAFTAPKQFVVGSSGHIAGVINPPNAHKRSFFVNKNPTFPENIDDWLRESEEHPGSWWDTWLAWIILQSGSKINAHHNLGNKEYSPLSDAPGSYVKVKI